MSTLVSSIDTFKENVVVSYNFTLETILPFIKKQERKHIKPVIGSDLYTAWTTIAPTTGNLKEVFTLLQEASSNLAMLSYSKVAIVSITQAGFLIATGQDSTPAEWWQIRDLRRSLLETGLEALDEALLIMEENQEEFPQWVSSSGYTFFKELFTQHTTTFNRYYTINSRLAFLKLRPHLLKVETQYFDSLLGTETVTQIKAEATDEDKKALQLCQAAQVPLCVAAIASEGIFEITPSGIFTGTDELPGQKTTKAQLEELDRLQRLKEREGMEQLKILTGYLRANPLKFIAFAAKEKISILDHSTNTKSIASF